MTDPEIGPVRRLLVVRPGGIGDLILLVPILRLLRSHYPDAAIDLICEKRNIEVLSLAGLEVEPVTYDQRPLRLLTRLCFTHYDLVVDTEQFHHFSAVFALLCGAKRRIGFKINPLRNPLYTHLVNYAPDGYEGDQFFQLLQPLGIETGAYAFGNAIRDHVPALPDTATAQWESQLGAAPVVVIHMGSSTASKRWPETRFIELGRRLHTRENLGIVVLGGQGERSAAGRLVSALREFKVPALTLVGSLSLSETAAAIRKAQLFVGPDSGIGHLAIAVGTPTVRLFGPSDPAKWGLERDRHAVVRIKLPCSPCFIFGYSKPCRTFDCMQGITLEHVLDACHRCYRTGIGAGPDTGRPHRH